ncbi:TraR/DksA C4-type zinc finger protein [Streptomyces sp. NPDC002853]
MSHDAHLRLEHERDSRLTQLTQLNQSTQLSRSRAIGGAGHEVEEQVMLAQKETIERVLKEIEAALARVRDGSYGTCPTCAKPIPVERLEILPYTQFCVPCQRRTG